MSPKVKDALHEFIDILETEYGEVEGFEVKLEHPIIPDEGKRQGFADIKEFVLIYLTRHELKI
jgi:hypothetical protein